MTLASITKNENDRNECLDNLDDSETMATNASHDGRVANENELPLGWHLPVAVGCRDSCEEKKISGMGGAVSVATEKERGFAKRMAVN
jgi:hypothetical protein